MSQGLVGSAPVNNASQKPINSHSKFDTLKYHNFQTYRFGEYCPHFVMECVPSDVVRERCSHDVRSYTLKAPLMQNIEMHRDYFSVPLQAILPINSEKFYTNPLRGDDVPEDSGCYVDRFLEQIFILLQWCVSNSTVVSTDDHALHRFRLLWALHYHKLLNLIFEDGCLWNNLGVKLSECVRVLNPASDRVGIDVFTQDFLDGLLYDGSTGRMRYIAYRSSTTEPWKVVVKDKTYIPTNLSGGISRVFTVRDFWYDFLENDCLYIEFAFVSGSDAWPDGFVVATCDSDYNISYSGTGIQEDEQGLNLYRLWAYQLVIAEYYSNDHVDYIYSSQLLRDLVSNYYLTATGGSTYPTFTYNGIKTQYDIFSAKIFADIVARCLTVTTGGNAVLQAVFSYFGLLFGFRNSLRYRDYFVGSKAQPLAVGDVNVNVSGGVVSVVDVTRNIQLQRFLNSVNRTGRKFSEYIKGLFGVTPSHDWHHPLYLSHTKDNIFAVDVENTGDAQMRSDLSVTSTLRSNGSRYEFEFHCDRPSILIGITSFDIARAYVSTVDRQAYARDRFDMFNPYMQFVGDQQVYLSEIAPYAFESGYLGHNVFGYQLRDMQYKQRFNVASGGFVRNLPGFAFMYDIGALRDGTPNGMPIPKISPEFIRSYPYELDYLYLSLTGLTYSSYFHFIVSTFNDCEASRPMSYAPSIL